MASRRDFRFVEEGIIHTSVVPLMVHPRAKRTGHDVVGAQMFARLVVRPMSTRTTDEFIIALLFFVVCFWGGGRGLSRTKHVPFSTD